MLFFSFKVIVYSYLIFKKMNERITQLIYQQIYIMNV